MDSHTLTTRHVFTLMGFLCFTVQYMLRTSLSITIVAMVNSSSHTLINKSNECHQSKNINITNNNITVSSKIQNGEFDWDDELQGIILSAFFWGYISPMLLSGWLANRYGGKIMFICGLATDGFLSLLIPLAARTHVGFLIACRVLMGFAEGIMIPSFHCMLGKWSPPNERSRMNAFSYSGQPLGIILVMAMAGMLCDYAGWPSVFYSLGVTALLCTGFWLYFVYDSPSVHPRISEKEKLYIQTQIGATESKEKFLPVPWKAILQSPPVWAIGVVAFGYSWGHFMLLTQLPNYMKNVLGFNIKENGILSGLPYVVYFLFAYFCGTAGDWIIKRQILSVTRTRKAFQIIASGLPSICLIAITFSGCNTILIICWLVMAGGFFGAVFTGLGVNHIDLSPNFSGILQGITLTVGNLAGVFAPYVIGIIIKGEQTRHQWNTAYYTTGTILLLSTIVYLLFGSGELQPWNEPKLDEAIHISQEKISRDKKFEKVNV